MDEIDFTKKETLRAKLEKVLRLAGQSASPEEAASAAAFAQSLAFKYNIDLEQVRSQMRGQERTFTDYKKNTVNVGRKGMTTWHTWLLSTIATNNFCKLVLLNGLGADRCKYGELFGEPHNIDVVLYMYEYLEREIRRLGREAWKTAQYATDESERIWFRSYCHGAVDTVITKLNAQRRQSEAEQAQATGTGLVLMTQARLTEAYELAYPKLGKGRKSKMAADGEAYWQGRRDAQSITLTPGLTVDKK